MRILTVNHLRLGSSPGGIPAHLTPDIRAFSTRTAWQRTVTAAIENGVHAVVLTGQTLSPINTGLEPWGPLVDGLADLRNAGIPVIAVENGAFTPKRLSRFADDDAVHWLGDSLEWEPIFTTGMERMEPPAVHVVAATLAEHHDSPVENPVTMDDIDYPGSIWVLTNAMQPDSFIGEHALVIEPGSVAPLAASETGRHGAWLIDTDARESHLLPLANLELAAINIDVSAADDLETFERIISERLADLVHTARQDDSIAQLILADITLSGATRLYSAVGDTANDLQRMLVIERDGVIVAISRITNDTTPLIDLDPLLNRPDPVGEVARLIDVLESGTEPTEAQSRLITSSEQKLLAISHARVFGSILDTEPEIDASTLLRRQGWATLDALVRQRGID